MKKMIVACCLACLPLFSQAAGFEHFITAEGHRLMDGDRPFRFISFNVPTLNYQEDEMAFTETNPYALPTEYEMRDVFESVKQMGGRVIRIYTIPVRNKNFPEDAPTYVEAPGEFNEKAFKVTDRMLALANEYEIRIIFSLLNNWPWMGGRPNYADFRGKTKEDFWTDPQLIEDFKKTVEYTVTRKNTITGIRYKDDKAILCWETGNELSSPMDWTREITRYIKSLDDNHLVLDGFYAIDDRAVREESVAEPSIDIVSSHHYEKHPKDIWPHIQKSLEVVDGRKPYVVGEFGFVSTTAVADILDNVIAEPEISGALTWSLRHHRGEGGFYWHSEPLGGGIFKAYHWPGFESGERYDETNLLQTYRRKAFAIQGLTPPAVPVPKAPELLPVDNVYSITWRGSAGAGGYNVERAPSKDGPWTLVGYNISDADTAYFPLFHDETAGLGEKYYYRITALNRSGESGPSNIEGPVKVEKLALVDEMKNYGVLYHGKDVEPVTGNDRSFKERLHRLAGESGSEVTYLVPGDLEQFKFYAFEKTKPANLTFYGSGDAREWTELKVAPEEYVNAEGNYDYWRPKIYSGGGDWKYIKIRFRDTAQLARAEITYTE